MNSITTAITAITDFPLIKPYMGCFLKKEGIYGLINDFSIMAVMAIETVIL